MGYQQGRVNIAMATEALVLIMMIIGQSVVLTSAKHVVAFRTGGWTFGVACNWPGNGKVFKANDTLVFKYSPQHHNVVRVTKAGYLNCTAPEGARVYSSGNDNIKLVKGQNYFICTYPNHCTFGVRLNITAV
ncbi:hypothetical protein CsatB_015139 [Cannabis sativa]|uniref:Phytocyanin domain-containing protein n=1 Tax=Cannabis sativa TaxID=3483 RepID=A0A7J6GQE8_CANSA|nr:basic blue protein-like [Cannabis sativa]KAF4376226.1 hypothetical protein F8388_018895 [Cannabis sativa]KAF4384978.1 hypothetical protein F8388_010576 [Cannabis sativa]